MRSTALVGNPLEPRLFVYKRDRSALELLRNDDAKRWCDRHSLPPPTLQQQHHERGGKTGGIEVTRGVEATANERFPFVTFTEEQCRSDPLSLESRQVPCVASIFDTLFGGLVSGSEYDRSEKCTKVRSIGARKSQLRRRWVFEALCCTPPACESATNSH